MATHANSTPAPARRLPPVDLIPSAWASLAPDVQAELGRLAIKEALLRFAAGEYEGDDGQRVVYLDNDGRAEAEEAAEAVADMIRGIIETAFPDLFGHSPSPACPKGTDPAWAFAIRGGADVVAH